MLCDNLKNLRKAKGLSQEELAIKINVVRQTVSKWEKGLSVPDSELLIRIAEALETSVNVLLGESVEPPSTSDKADDSQTLAVIAAKLELLNEQFARRNENGRKIWRVVFVVLAVLAALLLLYQSVLFIHLATSIQSSISIIGGADGPTNIQVVRSSGHIGTWIFPLLTLIISIIGLCKTRKRREN